MEFVTVCWIVGILALIAYITQQNVKYNKKKERHLKLVKEIDEFNKDQSI